MMGVFEEIRTYPVRFLKSCGLFSCFLCMGLSMGIVGPTLLDFKVKTQSPLSLAALIFPVRAGGYAFGTFVSGMFYHKMDVQKLITVTMTISGVITLAIPFISDIKLLLLAFAIVGLSLGLYSSGGNMWVLDLWGKGNPPFLQAAHFMLGFGAFAAPLIARPFLRTEGILIEDPGECHELPEPPEETINNSTDTYSWRNDSTVSTLLPPPEPIDPNDINLTVPFAIIAAIEFLNAIFFIIMKIMYPVDELHPSRLTPTTTATAAATAAATRSAHLIDLEEDDVLDDNEVNVTRKLSLIGLSRGYNSLGPSFTRASKRSNVRLPFNNNNNSNSHQWIGRTNSTQRDTRETRNTVKCTLSNQLDKSSNTRQQKITTTTSFNIITKRQDDLLPVQQNNTKVPDKIDDEAIISYKEAGESKHFPSTDNDCSNNYTDTWRLIVIILAVLFMHIYYGLEIIFGTLLTTFTNKAPLHLETTEGATVTSIYWGTFAFWRLPTVFYVDYLGPIKTIFFNLIILVAGNILLVPWGDTQRWAVYSGSALVGLGASPIFASMFGVLESFFPVTPKIASCMITASMLGEFVFPSIISPFISCTPNVFLWVALFCSLSVVFLFLIITCICFTKLNTNIHTTPEANNQN